jgi:ABC-type multidrug transport system ATPase subunit
LRAAEQITNTVRTLPEHGQRITILSAQRLSSVMHADAIYVLENGRIVDSGRHDVLLEQRGSTTQSGASRSASGRTPRWPLSPEFKRKKLVSGLTFGHFVVEMSECQT